MSIGHTYKFFGFYISYTIFTLPLSIFHLSSMLLILCTFSPLSPSHSLNDNPHVLVVCLVCSRFFEAQLRVVLRTRHKRRKPGRSTCALSRWLRLWASDSSWLLIQFYRNLNLFKFYLISSSVTISVYHDLNCIWHSEHWRTFCSKWICWVNFPGTGSAVIMIT